VLAGDLASDILEDTSQDAGAIATGDVLLAKTLETLVEAGE
jgi:hypothetical protein